MVGKDYVCKDRECHQKHRTKGRRPYLVVKVVRRCVRDARTVEACSRLCAGLKYEHHLPSETDALRTSGPTSTRIRKMVGSVAHCERGMQKRRLDMLDRAADLVRIVPMLSDMSTHQAKRTAMCPTSLDRFQQCSHRAVAATIPVRRLRLHRDDAHADAVARPGVVSGYVRGPRRDWYIWRGRRPHDDRLDDLPGIADDGPEDGL